jgi:hypothetical protein
MVWADGLREACCVALAEFAKRRKDGDWGEPPGTATDLARGSRPTARHALREGVGRDAVARFDAYGPRRGPSGGRLRTLVEFESNGSVVS